MGGEGVELPATRAQEKVKILGSHFLLKRRKQTNELLNRISMEKIMGNTGRTVMMQ